MKLRSALIGAHFVGQAKKLADKSIWHVHLSGGQVDIFPYFYPTKVCCWVLSGISTWSDFDVNTVHHDNTNDTGEDHIDENIVRQPINVGQWLLVCKQTVPRRDSQHICNTCCSKSYEKDWRILRLAKNWRYPAIPVPGHHKDPRPTPPREHRWTIFILLDYTIKAVVLHL